MSARRWVLLALSAAVYVTLRLTLNREYDGAPWEALVAGTAQLPFGHRVLVPWAVRPFVGWGVSVRTAFAVTEWVATVAAISGIEAALRRTTGAKPAQLAAGAFLGVLGLAFLLRFRWPVFYPWDTPAIAFTAWGVAFAQARRHGPLVVLAAVAALNRESAILLPVVTLVLLLGTPHRKEALRSASLQLVVVVLVRLLIALVMPIDEGGAVDLRVEGMWRIDHNLQWLAGPKHALKILGAFSLLPVLWVALRAHIPLALRRLELVIIPAMAGLMVVANIYEPRAWGEPLTLLYLGVAAGTARWMGAAADDETPLPVDRWGAAALLGLVVVALVVWVGLR